MEDYFNILVYASLFLMIAVIFMAVFVYAKFHKRQKSHKRRDLYLFMLFALTMGLIISILCALIGFEIGCFIRPGGWNDWCGLEEGIIGLLLGFTLGIAIFLYLWVKPLKFLPWIYKHIATIVLIFMITALLAYVVKYYPHRERVLTDEDIKRGQERRIAGLEATKEQRKKAYDECISASVSYSREKRIEFCKEAYSIQSGMMLHKEQCTIWEYMDGRLGTKNTCDEAVFVQFMVKDRAVIERVLSPGEIFDTGLTRSETSYWMFTTCPVGYVSSVPLKEENNTLIRASAYSCAR